MSDLPSSVIVPCLHSPEMIRAELASMLEKRPAITPRSFLRLWMAGSPFVAGGVITARDEARAQALIGKRLPAMAIVREMETALRALETIVPSAHAGRKLDKEVADSLGPEWLADLYASVSRAAPSTTWEDFLHRYPLALVAHLCAASHRANGGHTARPSDFASAFRELKAFRGNG